MVPSPTPEVTPTESPTPTVGPTPTPVTVEQPPSPTPRPTATPEPGVVETPTVPPDDGLDMALNLGQVRDGFCTGGLISVMLLTVWGLYVVAKAGVRWLLRQRSVSSGG